MRLLSEELDMRYQASATDWFLQDVSQKLKLEVRD